MFWQRQKHNVVRLVLIALTFLTACSTTPQVLDAKIFYRRDLPVTVVYETKVSHPETIPTSGSNHFEGSGVLNNATRYTFIISPKGNAKMDLLAITTCHREFSGEKLSPGFFGKNRYKYEYTPVKGVEDTPQCLIRMNVLDANTGKHAWALFDVQDRETLLPAEVTCNGETVQSNGVSLCQSRSGLVQRITFAEEVDFVPSKCPIDAPKGRVLELKMPMGECVFAFKGKDSGRIHRLTTVGYEGLLIRETD